MTRVHYLQFELDAPDIGGLLAAIGRSLSAEAPAQPAAAPRLLSAGRVRPPTNGAHKVAREPKTDEEPGRKRQGQMKELVLQALKDGPKIVGEVAEWVRRHGVPDYTKVKTSGMLNYLCNLGQVAIGKDHEWRLKG